MERLEANSTWEPNSGCRIWLGAMLETHGAIKVAGKLRTIHRVAWELERGPIPKGLWVLHNCGVGLCFNVNHLRLGNQFENAADRKRHGGYKGRIGGGLLPEVHLSSLPMGRLPKSEPKALDHTEIRRIMDFDAETGVFRWRHRADRDHSWNMRHGGEEVGALFTNGYRYVNLHGRVMLLHRLAWLWMTGSSPEGQIDHINGDRADNRWSNLRLATQRQNSANQGLRTDNTSGVKGVSWDARKKLWLAQIVRDGKNTFLGYHRTIEEAASARAAAEMEQQGDFARARPEHVPVPFKRKRQQPSPVRGVSFDKKRQRWFAAIMRDGKSTYLGRFVNFEDAVAARRAAESGGN